MLVGRYLSWPIVSEWWRYGSDKWPRLSLSWLKLECSSQCFAAPIRSRAHIFDFTRRTRLFLIVVILSQLFTTPFLLLSSIHCLKRLNYVWWGSMDFHIGFHGLHHRAESSFFAVVAIISLLLLEKVYILFHSHDTFSWYKKMRYTTCTYVHDTLIIIFPVAVVPAVPVYSLHTLQFLSIRYNKLSWISILLMRPKTAQNREL